MSTLTALVKDVETEDRKADRPALPWYISITISSYAPFDTGDMYYETMG